MSERRVSRFPPALIITCRSGRILLVSLPIEDAALLELFFVVYVCFELRGLLAFLGLLVVMTTSFLFPG